MRHSILALAAVAATLTGAAYAQQPPAPPPPGQPSGVATISRADAQTRASAMFDKFDANHDGKLDQSDRKARTTAMFDRIDGNHDGSISRDEFVAAHETMGRRMRGKGPGHGPGERGHGKMGHDDIGAGSATRAPLSREAFVAEALKRFDAADSNHDGKVTPLERRTAMRAHAGRMGPGGQRGADLAPPPPGVGS